MTILVTGATGNVGRLVVNHLMDAGAKVRALTTNPKKAALPDGVEVVVGYLGRLETMPAALEGVERMYLAPLASTVRAVVALAKEAGVKHIVDLSSTEAEAGAAGDAWGAHYYEVERAVEESGIPWTHLRAGEFMTNMLDWANEVRTTGVVRKPAANFASAPIDLDDIAAVAARALLEDGHIGMKYILTGPESIKRGDLVRIIGEVLGRDVRFEEQTREEALAELEPMIGDAAQLYIDSLMQWADYSQPTVSTVAEVTGRPATTFKQFVLKNIATFR